uniref:Ubiquinone/menaquinone biosynthesis C-methylase UbiE n=1 Tax=Candidatus Kentrum sp. UNK TaxID=2126344 RepID=A0A451B5R2_9GAMM|nr:MAG: Ubiquinone/menaquinone biosynthesis C-methylase UbiE [Candidatus Kentron sp. UNK]VFK73611.1 MAG: Ubiquinone/menaquinone biosynthesis C-methylase UbiE [Candidatus Kentron sp. UNK]
MAAYDKVANEFIKSKALPISIYLDAYTLFQRIGDLSGKSVLDLACGEGVHTRTSRSKEAIRVIGVDISEKMIDLARQKEAKEPLGIEYLVQDVLTLGKVGEFDLITAAYLLHYSKTREELLTMCRSIHANLKVGGRFVSISNNWEFDTYGRWDKYGLRKKRPEPIYDGATITVTLFGEDWDVSFDGYYFSKSTYEWAFRQAGFKSFSWYPPIVSPEGIDRFGHEFWEDAVEFPFFIGIELLK